MQGTVDEPIGTLSAPTESKEAPADIRLHTLVLESINDGALIVDASDPDPPIIYTNPAFQALTGYNAREVVGQNCRFLQGPDTDARTVERIRVALKTGNAFQDQILNYRKDGTSFWNLLRISPLRDVAGRITHFVGLQTDITEFKLAEEALRQSEERYRTLVESSPYCIHEIDLEGRLCSMNAAGLSMMGAIDERDVMGMPYLDVVSDDDRDRIGELLDLAYQGKPSEYEFRAVNGVFFQSSFVPITDDNDVVIKLMGLTQDITERKRAQDKLHESENRFRAMANSTSVMIWMSGLDKGGTFFNQQWLKFTGRSMEEEIGDGWSHGVHLDDIKWCLDKYAIAFDRRDDFVMEYRLRRHDGEYRWVIDTGTPCYTPDGAFTGYIGSCIDITDRKQTEQKLREEKRLSDSIIETLPGLFFMLDRQGRYVRWNKNTETLTGLSADELANRPAVDFVSPEDRERVKKAIEAGFRAGYVNTEFDNVTTEGTKISYAAYGVRTCIGGRNFLVGFEIDISEHKRAEEESRLLRDELAHANRLATVGELSATLAHELNQPLTAILSNAQAAQRFLDQERPDLNELRATLADIVDDDRRAGGVIQRLRALLTKGESQRTQQDINDIVREVVELVHSDAVARNIAISLKLDDDLPMIIVDRVQLQQVLLNLITNGFDAMQEVDGRRALQLQTTGNGTEVVNISVMDSGVGLEQEKMQHMFDAFFTTKPKGMGMGLSISRSIIDAHGGRLWASRNTERGMKLHIQLPVMKGIES